MLASTLSRREFPHTRWSLVQAANGLHSAAALEELCSSYWYPLYAYVRRSGYSAYDAQDLAQAFFCELLEKGWLGMADRERG
ncbi:MAG: sigma-70 family RNA polymerase sigma factor, partial [Chthoniobacteraceae bacterium]